MALYKFRIIIIIIIIICGDSQMVVPDYAVDITLDVAKDAPSGSMLATDLVESCLY